MTYYEAEDVALRELFDVPDADLKITRTYADQKMSEERTDVLSPMDNQIPEGQERAVIERFKKAALEHPLSHKLKPAKDWGMSREPLTEKQKSDPRKTWDKIHRL